MGSHEESLLRISWLYLYSNPSSLGIVRVIIRIYTLSGLGELSLWLLSILRLVEGSCNYYVPCNFFKSNTFRLVGDGYCCCAALGESPLSQLRVASSIFAFSLLSKIFYRKAVALIFRPRSKLLDLASDFKALEVASLISSISFSLSASNAGEALREAGKLFAIVCNAFYPVFGVQFLIYSHVTSTCNISCNCSIY